MEIIIIVAYAKNRVIGNNNKIPWHLHGDMKHFKEITSHNPIIMGRKTWESLRIKPLPNRTNIIITKNKNLLFEGAIPSYSITDAIYKCKNAEKIFIIGGAKLYYQFIPIASTILATEISSCFPGDILFPEINNTLWSEISREPQATENGINYDFVTYIKKPKDLLYN